MKTIEFRCPDCSQFCAFRENHAGRRARCLNCRAYFIIPASSDQVPKKVKLAECEEGPIGGFYRHLFALQVNKETLTGLVFLLGLALGFFVLRHQHFSFSFFVPMTGKVITILFPFGLITATLLLGMILSYDMEILRHTAFDLDSFPLPAVDNVFHFIALCIAGLYRFAVCLLAATFPALAVLGLLKGLSISSLWPFWLLLALGLFLLPAITATVAMSGDLLSSFRPDVYLRPIRKVPGPYLFMSLFFLLGVGAYFFLYSRGLFVRQTAAVNGLILAGHLAAVLFSALAARVTGLFCRHYSCYML